MSSCCSPSAGGRGTHQVGKSPRPAAPAGTAPADTEPRIVVEASSFLMGTPPDQSIRGDGEGPVREVHVDTFTISAHTVSNEQFRRFVEATGHETDAERYGWSFVFVGLLPKGVGPTSAVAAAPWWRVLEGVSWAHPEGPGSTIEDRLDHPVVHVSWNDARAYCAWAGGRLPTEAEWEKAARGGLEQQPFPWGSELEPRGAHRMNVWQGDFPMTNTLADGWLGTAPVDAYPPNAFGLYNMTGNVWEWTLDPFAVDDTDGRRVTRGGSYLCHASYCRRYRVSARSGNFADDSTGNIGFRCVWP